jgi:hypothetical protein
MNDLFAFLTTAPNAIVAQYLGETPAGFRPDPFFKIIFPVRE